MCYVLTSDLSSSSPSFITRFLPVGAPVEFYVFEDDAGLGAEECSVTEGCLDGSSWFSGLV